MMDATRRYQQIDFIYRVDVKILEMICFGSVDYMC